MTSPSSRAQAEGGRGVVAQTRPERSRPARRDGLPGLQHRRQQRAPAAHRQLEQVAAVGVVHRVEIAGAAGVASVGGQFADLAGAAQSPGQPIVGQTHRRRAVGVVGFAVGQPAQLGHRDRRQRHHAHGIRPGPRPAQLGHQRRSRIGRAGVIPQQRRSHRVAVAVEAHHAVLLGRDRDRGHVVEPTGGRDRAGRRGFPSGRIDFGAVRMWCATLANDLARAGIADQHLARLRRRVDAGDQCHGTHDPPPSRNDIN